MKISLVTFLSVVRLVSAGMGQSSRGIAGSFTDQSQQTLQQFANLPMSFEINQGQTSPEVRFLSRGTGYQLFLTADQAVMMVGGTSPKDRHRPGQRSPQTPSPASLLRMKLIGSNPSTRVEGKDQLEGKSNYFIGNDPAKWRTNVAQFARVQYHDVYPGVDLVYYGNQGQLEHDFVIAPGADLNRIRLSVDGATKLAIDDQGSLRMKLANSDLQLKKPIVYQEIAGTRREVRGQYSLVNNEVSFSVGEYDKRYALVIDPVLTYSTFLGGTGDEGGPNVSIAVDSAGNAYVAGDTRSFDYPITTGSVQTGFGGSPSICDQFFPSVCGDAMITKINPAGTAIVYSTYLGGNNADAIYGLVVDAGGNVYVSGLTESTNFPVTPGAFQQTFGGANCPGYETCGDAFVTKINSAGSALVYSTYLGGSDNEYSEGLAVDSAGNAYVTGPTLSLDFPTTPGVFQPAYGGSGDGFVTKLNAVGSKLLYSSYLGGSSGDQGFDIKVDAAGRAYIAGETSSVDFPITTTAYQSHVVGDDDVFATVVSANGAKLVYSTYLGGSGKDWAYGSSLDASGNYYLTGFTASSDFPVTPGASQTTFGGGICNTWYGANCSDAFIAKLSTAKSGAASLVYSTYLGGSKEDQAASIAVDSQGDAYVAGWSASVDFPLVSPIQALNHGQDDVMVAKLDPTGSTLLYSTFLGGSNFEIASWIALDQTGNAYVAGYTQSTDFPTTARVFQPTFAGGKNDLFVVKLGSNNAAGVSFVPVSLAFSPQTAGTASPSQTVVLNNVGSAPLRITSIQTTGNFSQTNTCGASVAGGGSCAVSITFSPVSAGNRTGMLSVTDNASGSPQKLVLSGIGK
jgi:Beta-propeller repeat/Abnormal spindle-like microcephaly-assoc'd, ASPM-SPD-2-Hydin